MDPESRRLVSRRLFLATSGLAVGGALVGCGGRRRGVPDGSVDGDLDLGVDTDMVSSDAQTDLVDAPIGQSAATDVFVPELSAPPSSSGYSDGNIILHHFPHPEGGSTTIWVGAEGRQLRITAGTPISDQVFLSRPRDQDAITDLLQFQNGHLHFEIQSLLGDSVLSDALTRARLV